MSGVYINPKTDFAFKKIFGSKQSTDILISFLNAILYQSRPIIEDLEILDPYQAPRIKGIKDSYLDVKATIVGNKTVIIEMQVLNVLGFEKRVLYNAAKAFSIQLNIGDDYTLLNPVIALTITDFEMFSESPKVISRYKLKEQDDLTDYSEDIELVFVELPKFNKPLNELETITDKWLYFLKCANQLEEVPSSLESIPAINHAFSVAKQSKLTRKELEVLEKREIFIHDSRNAILKARQEGRQEGRREGRQEGEAIGAKQRAIDIARQLLDVLDIETISQKTGLSIEEIQALR
ncbi:transposase [Phormidesmis priestleyi ULC007]|uniref:Transposase n=1 Tax=Phormidesmis priestleyi ULC007 TaxID=1920490 RepID=A0A2T1D7C1_9CYAN|nr:Rpn family recombination-promoting nuclease/putative transposase [Phormidesmis priestleyi]PSB16388.1 transposase [Phormidesmis priestleyi ULC007]PZO47197.1 MAG: Rpn family recombination-promoting nuclease/putative transposase [Phormidesmis priestleyi]